MGQLLSFTDKGIFCEQGDFYIDPWRPVKNAIITHGHSDHSRLGHTNYLTHTDSTPILKHRLGTISVEGIKYRESFFKNGVKVSLHPAGHILGSAQVRVEHKGEVWVASGDYKTGPDPVAEAFEPVKCHTFITECTFGLPVFRWPAEKSVIEEVESWWRSNIQQNKVSLLCAYALGKAQRVLSLIDPTIGPIYVHGAVHSINAIHRDGGFLEEDFPYLSNSIDKESLRDALIVAPPSAAGSTWANKLKPLSVAMASGWMLLRGSKRRRNVDRGFILSDHADWDGLNAAIKETGAENIICTHGYTDQYAEWLRYIGYNAYTEKTLFEGESIDENVAKE
ncbi:MAG: ligase-associated DNA damage response exonuclease [Ekhidna sp.]|nr:ligase-associated DNA damage response exonuclease [Ekhidna sp.]